MIRRTLIGVLLTVLAGCAVYTHHGLYEASAVEDWRLVQREGSFSFISPKHAGRGVLFSTPSKGKLYLHVYFPTEGEVKFGEQHLRLIPHDGTPVRSVPISISMTIAVPDASEFTVALPAFTVGGERMPPFAARFKWSDRTYRIIRELQ